RNNFFDETASTTHCDRSPGRRTCRSAAPSKERQRKRKKEEGRKGLEAVKDQSGPTMFFSPILPAHPLEGAPAASSVAVWESPLSAADRDLLVVSKTEGQAEQVESAGLPRVV